MGQNSEYQHFKYNLQFIDDQNGFAQGSNELGLTQEDNLFTRYDEIHDSLFHGYK